MKKSSVLLRPPKKFTSAFVCGMTAATLAQGCRQDLRPISSENLAFVRGNQIKGENLFFPVLEELVEAAPDESTVFGFNGHGGVSTFFESLQETKETGWEILADGRLYEFNDPEYDHAAFFRNHPLADGKDLIAFNRAFLYFAAIDEPYDDDSGKQVADVGVFLHEAAHNDTIHSEKTNEFTDSEGFYSGPVEESYKQILTKERDFAYLLSFSFGDLESFFQHRVLFAPELLQAYLDGYRNYGAQLEKTQKENIEKTLADFSTPEGWASWAIDEDRQDIFRDYFEVPIDERRRIVFGSGWYEEFLEGELGEIINEAKREFDLEGRETELRVEINLRKESDWGPKLPRQKL